VERVEQVRTLMLLYSGGIVLIFGTFVALYRHAWGHRERLRLSRAELIQLRFGMRAHVLSLSLGVASIVISLVSLQLTFFAGIIYGLMGPLQGWNGYAQGRAMRRLESEKTSGVFFQKS
jgi:hypothetical protein